VLLFASSYPVRLDSKAVVNKLNGNSYFFFFVSTSSALIGYVGDGVPV